MTFFSFTLISSFFGAVKTGGFGVALKNPSRWKSVTWLEEVGVSTTGSGTILQVLSSVFLPKIGQRRKRLVYFDFHVLDLLNLQR